MQCPFIPGNLEMIRQHCEAHGVPADFIEVDTLRKAKELPCVFNNWGVFYKGRFETVNLLDAAALERILKSDSRRDCLPISALPSKNLRTLRRSGCSIPPVPALFCFFCPLFRDSFRIFVIRI